MTPRVPRSLAVLLLLAGGCGHSTITSSSSATTGSLIDSVEPRDPAPVVTITAAGFVPQISHLDHGVTVRFVNQDVVSHRLLGAPELAYGICPEMEQLASLRPGESGTVTVARNGVICAYKDETLGGARAFQGLLVVH